MSRGNSQGLELPYKRAAQVALAALVLGVAVAWPAQLALSSFPPVVSLVVIVLVVLVGVVADIIGVAATRGDEEPFLARASKRAAGARQGLYLIRHADAVATVLSDLVGDLSGTVSGALAAGLAIRVAHPVSLPLATAIVVGGVSAFSIGLKALSKAFAVRQAEVVVRLAGKVLSAIGFRPSRPKG